MTNNLTSRYLTKPMTNQNMLRSTKRLTLELHTLIDASPGKNSAAALHAHNEVDGLINLIQYLWSLGK